MSKHNFKIGQKVKLKNPSYWNMSEGDIGVIVGLGGYIRVNWGKTNLGNGNTGKGYPHLAREIERAVGVGEQLLFKFMNEVTK